VRASINSSPLGEVARSDGGAASKASSSATLTKLAPFRRLRRHLPHGGKNLATALLLALATPALADSLMPAADLANVQLPDPAKEKAAKTLMETIRCLVCQGQSVADSDSDLAGDMRSLIRQRINEGEPPETIRTWLIERYGNWVSYSPPASTITSPLLVLPVVFFVLGVWLIRGKFKTKKQLGAG
jgi:cytochrome c-type biogenesis protein CcmH